MSPFLKKAALVLGFTLIAGGMTGCKDNPPDEKIKEAAMKRILGRDKREHYLGSYYGIKDFKVTEEVTVDLAKVSAGTMDGEGRELKLSMNVEMKMDCIHKGSHSYGLPKCFGLGADKATLSEKDIAEAKANGLTFLKKGEIVEVKEISVAVLKNTARSPASWEPAP